MPKRTISEDAAVGLPTLEGSDKQISWATTFKPEIIEFGHAALAKMEASITAPHSSLWWAELSKIDLKFVLFDTLFLRDGERSNWQF